VAARDDPGRGRARLCPHRQWRIQRPVAWCDSRAPACSRPGRRNPPPASSRPSPWFLTDLAFSSATRCGGCG